MKYVWVGLIAVAWLWLNLWTARMPGMDGYSFIVLAMVTGFAAAFLVHLVTKIR